MVNDVTSRDKIRERFPDNTISRNCGGAWWTYGAALRLYNLTIIPRLWLLDVWLRRRRCTESRFRKFIGDLKKKQDEVCFLVHPSTTYPFGLYRFTAIRWAYPEFELTHETQPESCFRETRRLSSHSWNHFFLTLKPKGCFETLGVKGEATRRTLVTSLGQTQYPWETPALQLHNKSR